MIDSDRLLAAYEKARRQLLTERHRAGHWVGELSSSALSTATAVSALTLVERHDPTRAACGRLAHPLGQTDLSKLIGAGIGWLVEHQNDDGGWGDTDKSYSNIATSMLAVAAFHLTDVAAAHADLLQRAMCYIEDQGGLTGLRNRYGKDKTFAVPILTNCALANLIAWRQVAPLPFELACLPHGVYRFLRLPVVSYAIPALVAIGQARFFHQKPRFLPLRWIRAAAVERSLRVLQRMQPDSGGYLEAVPLTSFVVMSLAATGRSQHTVTRQGLRFLVNSVRPDGSWPIDTNLATWNTSLALNALAAAGEDVARFNCLEWLLSCQHRDVHPFTAAQPGGWGWTDLSGAVPDADDTPGALLVLAAWRRSQTGRLQPPPQLMEAAAAGIRWLLDLQNRDGGWPTFCRGWGKLPFDRSGADLTAHALRALRAWRGQLNQPAFLAAGLRNRHVDSAVQRGFAYLARTQAADGSWSPLWFGNQDHPREENPVYGTSKVILAYRDGDRSDTPPAARGLAWLKATQQEDGGWGAGLPPGMQGGPSSVEQTALAVEALLTAASDESLQVSIARGLRWLIRAVEQTAYLEPSPIGFYFAKLWYHEQLYPLIFTVSALGQAVQKLLSPSEPKPAAANLPNS